MATCSRRVRPTAAGCRGRRRSVAGEGVRRGALALAGWPATVTQLIVEIRRRDLGIERAAVLQSQHGAVGETIAAPATAPAMSPTSSRRRFEPGFARRLPRVLARRSLRLAIAGRVSRTRSVAAAIARRAALATARSAALDPGDTRASRSRERRERPAVRLWRWSSTRARDHSCPRCVERTAQRSRAILSAAATARSVYVCVAIEPVDGDETTPLASTTRPSAPVAAGCRAPRPTVQCEEQRSGTGECERGAGDHRPATIVSTRRAGAPRPGVPAAMTATVGDALRVAEQQADRDRDDQRERGPHAARSTRSPALALRHHSVR